MGKEIRMLAADLELRKTEDEKRQISGYAVKWEQLSQKLGWFYRFQEKFAKGAFEESLSNDTQRALWNHNTDIVLGNTKNSTLVVEEDDVGLRFDIDLPNNSWGNDVYESISRGDVDGVSFGFTMQKEEWDESDPDNIVRTVNQAKLFEVSPTPFPAYEGVSEVSARSMDEAYKTYIEANKPEKSPEESRWLLSLRKKINS